MTGGTEMSARERESRRARAGVAGLGRVARPRRRERADGPHVGWAESKEERRKPARAAVFVFKNVNSDSICLFH
jgi:hypothetical protein